MTKVTQCKYHGGIVIRLTNDLWFCIPAKGFYTGTNGHELNRNDLE